MNTNAKKILLAFITAFCTLGCAAGNFIDGQPISAYGLQIMLFAGIAMAIAGTWYFS